MLFVESLGLLGLTVGSVYALFAASFAVIFNVTHVFHLGHGAIITIGGYLVYVLATAVRLPTLAAILVAIACTGGVGAATELGIYRPLRSRGVPGSMLFLASVGMLVSIEGLTGLIFGPSVLALRVLPERTIHLGAATFTSVNAVMPLAWLFVVATVAYVRLTRTGRLMRSVGDSPDVARTVGVDTNRVFLVSFALGSALTVPAVVLYASYQGLSPQMGLNAILVASTAVLIAGRDVLAGAICGLAIGVLQSEAVAIVPSSWQEAMVFGVLLLVILVRPQGILSARFSS